VITLDANKTIIFGLDGADFDMIDPWLEAGALPTLQGLIDRGGRTKLESCVPATTPPAWTSLTTGVNPGKHGIFGFYSRQKGTYDIEPVSDGDVYARRLWDYASMAGLTSLVVNVPVTHPGRELDGALVPGYLARDEPETYPAGLLEEVGMPEYRVYAESESDDVPEERLLEEWLELSQSRSELALRLMERYDWDVLFLEFQKTDGAVHKFDDRGKVRRIFECVDGCLAEVLDAVDGDPNVFVVSDHGIGQEKDWSVALNTWLAEHGYAETTTSEGREKAGWIEEATGEGDRETSPDGAARLLGALGSVGLTKQRIERLLSAAGLYGVVTRLAPAGLGDSLEGEVIDHERSRAFYEGMGFSGVDVGVVLNDERFYSGGTVSEAEYESVRAELLEALEDLEGPERLAFRSVQHREAVYSGPRTEYAPDIVVEQAPRYVIGSQYPRGETFIPAEKGRIDHRRNGILVAAGPDVRGGWSPSGTPSIMDVTPTLLHLLGVALNELFDGRVLESVLANEREMTFETFDRFEPGGVGAFTEKEEENLRNRLQGMGYLE
jgi:predicted AlkP superfamily phosphohydrolase/phosphomutase